MEPLKFLYEDIIKIQKNRDPFLMIDCATEVYLGKSAKGYKLLPSKEWFFKAHWKNDPNMPGMLQLEAMTQMASLTILGKEENHGKVMYIFSMDKIRFIQKVLPESKLEIVTELISWNKGVGKFKAKCFVNQRNVSRAEFNLMLPDEFRQYRDNS
jgi:3-hydroxyacyl-[acyl-carrier-protein] dehydratase